AIWGDAYKSRIGAGALAPRGATRREYNEQPKVRVTRRPLRPRLAYPRTRARPRGPRDRVSVIVPARLAAVGGRAAIASLAGVAAAEPDRLPRDRRAALEALHPHPPAADQPALVVVDLHRPHLRPPAPMQRGRPAAQGPAAGPGDEGRRVLEADRRLPARHRRHRRTRARQALDDRRVHAPVYEPVGLKQ